MLSLENSLNIGLGDSLTLLCAVLFAAQIVAISFFTSDIDPVVLTIIQLAVCALFSNSCCSYF
jgi:drug/metabolite transporter (DMT)-like permease